MGENRIAVISIIVEDRAVSEKINATLSLYGEYILGRMGIPYREKGFPCFRWYWTPRWKSPMPLRESWAESNTSA